MIDGYLDHYHRDRNHQGLDNKIIEPDSVIDRTHGNIRHRERLGGMFHYYYRDAAWLLFGF